MDFVETHTGLLSLFCSVCMLIVTAIYAVITWWQGVNVWPAMFRKGCFIRASRFGVGR